MVHIPTREVRQFLQETVYLFVVGDTGIVRVLCRRAVFVSVDGVAGDSAPGGLDQFRR